MPESIILAQLAREPVVGQVKTRLMPTLSAQQAVNLHSAMVEHMARVAVESGLGELQLWVDGNIDHPLFERCRELGASSVYVQAAGDLGDRMAAIARRSLSAAGSVILLGSDVPAIDPKYLQAAAQALIDVDAVVGPALDGGYVLLALRRYSAELFSGISWGGEEVLAQTIARLEGLGWSYQLLAALPDIDRPEDLRHLPDSLRVDLQGVVGA